MPAQYLYPSYILSEDRKTFLRELTNRQYKAFVKCINLEDQDVLEIFIDSILQELLYDNISINALTNVDKLYMLICVRSYCISPTIVYSAKVDTKEKPESGKDRHEKKRAKVEMTLNLNEILNRLGNYPIKHKFTFSENGLTVNGTLPKRFYYNHIVDVAVDCLNTVQFRNRQISLVDMKRWQRKIVLDSLPSSVLPLTLKFLEAQSDMIKNDPLIKFSANEKITLPFDNELKLHMYNGTIGEIVKLLFNTSIKELYNMDYTLMRRFRFTYNAMEKSSPAELSVYHEIIQQDLEREKKEQEQQQGKERQTDAPKNLRPE